MADINRPIEYAETTRGAATPLELGAGGLWAVSGLLKKPVMKRLRSDIGAVDGDPSANMDGARSLSDDYGQRLRGMSRSKSDARLKMTA